MLSSVSSEETKLSPSYTAEAVSCVCVCAFRVCELVDRGCVGVWVVSIYLCVHIVTWGVCIVCYLHCLYWHCMYSYVHNETRSVSTFLCGLIQGCLSVWRCVFVCINACALVLGLNK